MADVRVQAIIEETNRASGAFSEAAAEVESLSQRLDRLDGRTEGHGARLGVSEH